ncbi:T5orf172 domain-containing protein, partial [Parachaetomium inaequale]
MSEHSSSHHLNTPPAGTKRRRTSKGLRQPEQTALQQDQVSSELCSPLHTSTPTSRPTTASRSTSSALGSRDAPIEILSLGDESPSASRAGRRRQLASSNTSTPSRRPRPALHAARPKPEIRSANDPLPRQVQQQPPNSDTAIEALIREPPKTREGRASVYVMTATHEENRIVKVGFTTSVNQRIKQLEQTCRGIEFHRETIELHPPTIDLYYGTVERLAHTELQRFRYDFDCTCKKRHAEYFKVDAERARHIVQRWTQFCEARPWEAAEAGQKLELKDQWRDCL